MIRSYSYNYCSITFDQILKLKEEMHDRHRIKLVPDEIRPFKIRPDFKDEFGLPWKKYENLFKKYQNKIRKYSFTLTKPYGPKEYDSRFDVTVRIKENSDQDAARGDYPSIKIMNFGGDDYDFEIAREILEEFFDLEFSENQLKKDLLARFSSSIANQKLKDKVSSSMASHDYDTAMSSAVIFVESKLRDKCLSVGATSATHQSGHDLANTAYHKDNGCLEPPYPVAKEASEGVFQLFRGFFLYLRNAFGHNTQVMENEKECIIEYLNLCDSLLKIIEKSTKK